MKIFKYLIFTALLLTPTLSFAEKWVSAGIGIGEYQNFHATTRVQYEFRQDIGIFHVGVKHETMNSKEGALDDSKNSLIEGDNTALAIGIHSDRGTSLTLYESKKYFEIDIESRVPNIRYGLGIVSGLNHLDLHGGTLTKSGGRRTSGARVGAFYEVVKGLEIEATYNIRNNTAPSVDDYWLYSMKYKF